MDLPSVSRILLERETQQRDVLVADGVEETANDATAEPLLLVVVHRDNLTQ